MGANENQIFIEKEMRFLMIVYSFVIVILHHLLIRSKTDWINIGKTKNCTTQTIKRIYREAA
jgi:hypothetical protein